jgi:iron complex outermembrane receptor protein
MKNPLAVTVAVWLLTVLPHGAAAQDAGTVGDPAAPASESSEAQAGQEARQAASLDLDQLAGMDVKVISASKEEERLFEAPAAIFVLTGEDIRRGGFTTLPEALRMVPGLYVAQTNSHLWQVSARGFSDLENNKMLVLVDGRSEYSPELGTVYWDVLDLPLENIERVEVIRGPGGTLWGENAVNGVINIITKTAEQMQGMLVSSSASAETGYTTTVRYGGQIGQKLTYSLFGRASYWEPFESTFGGSGPDQFLLPQAGLRLDWTVSSKDTVSLESGGYDGRQGSASFTTGIPSDYLVKGGEVQVRWKHIISDRSSLETLAYCDWYTRFGAPGEKRNSCDLELQHSYEITPRQTLISGGSFFSTGDDLTPDPAAYLPERRRSNVITGFAQYDIRIIPDRLRVLGGAKLEHNDYTGFEYQPQGRLVWTPNRLNAFWTSVSRSVRVPSRNDSDLDLFTPAGTFNGEPAFQIVTGNPNLQSEHILAYEVGYRVQPSPALSFDLALYYNRYNNLIISSPAAIQVLPTSVLIASQFVNGPDAQTHGAELSARWRPVRCWAISGAITETRGSASAVLATPLHLFNIQSRVDLPHKTEFDSALYHYSALALAPNASNPSLPLQSVPTLNRIDVGFGWHLGSQWTFSLWGRNLQSGHHVETRDDTIGDGAEEVPRSLAFEILWRFKPEHGASQ